MDKEAIQVNVRYQELERQHFSGGYYSEAVREQTEKLKQLSEDERRAFFAHLFNTIYSGIEKVHAHERCVEEEVDLTDEGLGVITVSNYEYLLDEEGDEEGSPFRGVTVWANAFNPTPERESVWINAPGDDLGLETSGPTMVQTQQEPKDWGEHIYADLDGSFHDSNGHYDMDTQMMRLLDAKETLDLVMEALSLDK